MYGQQNYYQGRGRGGRAGGGGGGRGGRGRGAPFPRYTPTFKVNTNLFDVTFTSEQRWHQYEINIIPSSLSKDSNEIKAAHPEKVERFQKTLKRGSNSRSREILNELYKQLLRKQMVLATDGASMGYSPTRLFDGEEEEFNVKIDRFSFIVKIIHRGEFETAGQGRDVGRMLQCLNTVFTQAMMSNWISVENDPKTFFLKDNEQRELLNRNILQKYLRSSYSPYVGLAQSAFFSDGKFTVAYNNKMDWLCKAGHPILDVHKQELAGVRIDIQNKINNQATREAITKKLKKMVFQINFTKGPKWEEEKRSKGKDDSWIKKMKTIARKGKKLFNRDKSQPLIFWCCEDHEFDVKERKHNPASYYADVYDIKLKYPHLPVICSGNNEFFPVEFLFQEVGRIPREGNEDQERLKEVLEYHDTHAGPRRLQHIKNLKTLASNNPAGPDVLGLTDLVRKFGFKVSDQTSIVDAKWLQSPALHFDGSFERNTERGSWNLLRKKFAKCAELASYAVVDLLGNRSSRNGSQVVMDNIFRAMAGHGMRVHNNGSHRTSIDHVTAYGNCERPEIIYDTFANAIEKAKEFFLAENKIFETSVKNKHGVIMDTQQLIAWDSKIGKAYLIPKGKTDTTHKVRNPRNHYEADARIQLWVETKKEWVDPHDLEEGHSFSIVGYLIEMDGLQEVLQPPEEVEVVKPLTILEEWQFEIPSMIFVFVPSKTTHTYDLVKTLADIQFQSQTQVIVQETCDRQRGLDQYCSSIALKINTKLFSSSNKACAWDLDGNVYGDLCRTKHTMILGFSQSRGIIEGSQVTVVAASVCLQTPMQMAQEVKILHNTGQKSDVVEADTIIELVKILAVKHYEHTKKIPERLIVYRDGGNDGDFDKIHNQEAEAVLEAITELHRCEASNSECHRWCQCSKCKALAPTLTFAIAQKDHDICVVPSNQVIQYKSNVPSGTVVETDSGFLLTSQGGLKGTSKPIKYRFIQNDEYLKNGLLENLTYQMAFQYGTATKAPRKVPVLLNSERLANRVIKYGGYLPTIRRKVDQLNQSDPLCLDTHERTTSVDVGEGQHDHEPIIQTKNRFRPHVTA